MQTICHFVKFPLIKKRRCVLNFKSFDCSKLIRIIALILEFHTYLQCWIKKEKCKIYYLGKGDFVQRVSDSLLKQAINYFFRFFISLCTWYVHFYQVGRTYPTRIIVIVKCEYLLVLLYVMYIVYYYVHTLITFPVGGGAFLPG